MTASVKPLSIAVVGVGLMGRRHADWVRRCPETRLAALVDPQPAALAGVVDEGYADIAEMLARVRVDGVIVATPTAHHLAPVLTALDHGIPVLLEKPLAATLQEAQQILDRCQGAGVPILVGHHRRHNPVAAVAKTTVQEQLGQLLGVVGQWTVRKPDRYFTEHWRQHGAAGPVLTNLVHDVDMLRFICGDIEAVMAEAGYGARESVAEDSVGVILKFRQGALGTFFLSDATPSPWTWEQGTAESPMFPRSGENSMRFMGTQGALEFPNLRLWRHKTEPGDWTQTLYPTVIETASDDAFMRQLRHFCAVIRGTEAPLVAVPDALCTLRAVLAIIEAFNSKQRQVL